MKIFNFFKKPLESVSDEITTKFKTPFFSTFIILWVIKNNLFVYDLFFNTSIKDKTGLLKTQFNIGELSFYTGTLKLIGITLLILVLFYLILNISRVITMISEERVKVNLLASLKSKTSVSKEDVDFWKERGDELNKKNFQLQEELNIMRSTNELTKNDLIRSKKLVSEFENASEVLRTNIDKILNDRIYTHQDTLKEFEFLDVNKIKESVNAHFNKFEKIGKPPTFISA